MLRFKVIDYEAYHWKYQPRQSFPISNRVDLQLLELSRYWLSVESEHSPRPWVFAHDSFWPQSAFTTVLRR